MTVGDPPPPIRISVERADALDVSADVLALKYAQAHYGADRAATERLATRGVEADRLPAPGAHRLVATRGALGAGQVLFIGVEPLHRFRYDGVRDFGRRALGALAAEAPGTRHLCLTIQGPTMGLDEAEAFRSQMAGLVDALGGGQKSCALERITIAEKNAARAGRFRQLLEEVFPGGALGARRDASRAYITAGASSDEKPRVFVAMPFADELEDRYEFGIKGGIHAAGYLCERVDEASFTGDILARIKELITGSTLVVADLTRANPNVYLEVGYAWGLGKRTVLLASEAAELTFDVKSQKCLIHKKIKDLRDALAAELGRLQESTRTSRDALL